MQRPLFVLRNRNDGLLSAVSDSVYDLAAVTGYSLRHLNREFKLARDNGGVSGCFEIVWVDWTDEEWQALRS